MTVDAMLGCFPQLCRIWSISYLLAVGAAFHQESSAGDKRDDSRRQPRRRPSWRGVCKGRASAGADLGGGPGSTQPILRFGPKSFTLSFFFHIWSYLLLTEKYLLIIFLYIAINNWIEKVKTEKLHLFKIRLTYSLKYLKILFYWFRNIILLDHRNLKF